MNLEEENARLKEELKEAKRLLDAVKDECYFKRRKLIYDFLGKKIPPDEFRRKDFPTLFY